MHYLFQCHLVNVNEHEKWKKAVLDEAAKVDEQLCDVKITTKESTASTKRVETIKCNDYLRSAKIGLPIYIRKSLELGVSGEISYTL